MNHIYRILFLILSISISAQTAPSYYNGVDFSLSGEALKAQLSQKINTTHDITVDYNELWEILQQTDLDPNNASNVLLIYGWDNSNAEDDDDLWRNKQATCGNGNPCIDESWNREHVFPKALDLSSSDDSGPTADPHMLRASDVEMNGARANRAFADGTGIASYITSMGDFYPGENWRGDVARIIMYMYVHYGEDWNPNLVGQGSNSYHADMPDIFLEWNAEDPVSQYEINRNNIVQGYQGNRNPFIDNPYLATRIWNGPDAENTWPDTMATSHYTQNKIQIYPNPTQDFVYLEGISPQAKIRIYNLQGQLINTHPKNGKILLPTFGMYILHITEDNHTYIYKVIKQ